MAGGVTRVDFVWSFFLLFCFTLQLPVDVQFFFVFYCGRRKPGLAAGPAGTAGFSRAMNLTSLVAKSNSKTSESRFAEAGEIDAWNDDSIAVWTVGGSKSESSLGNNSAALWMVAILR